MREKLTVSVIVLLTFICMIAIFENSSSPEAVVFTVLAQIFVNSILHFVFVQQGNLHIAALPAAWAACVVPLYIYCYYIMRNPGFFGRDFAFTIFGLLGLLPIFVVSSLTAVISYFSRKKSAKKPDDPGA